MALHRFFAEGPLPASGEIPLGAASLHHLRDVLRLAPGEEIVVVSGDIASRVRLTLVGEHAEGELLENLPAQPSPRVTLAQGLAKGEKMDDVVRQATEIGVARIVPFAAERSVVKLDGAKAAARAERWRRIAAEAAQQSQRSAIPQVIGLVPTAGLPDALAGATVLVCWEEATAAEGIPEAIARLAPGADDEIAVVVGPEGGLSATEVSLLTASGAVLVSLGGTVLRTETAGVVASALAVYARGGLGAHRG
jgi:16S rRNA (uracil1498-N3)-methyltransferase